MKNLILAISFTVFSLALPLSMAQQAVEVTNEAAEVSNDAADVSEVAEKETRGIHISIDTDDAEEVGEEIEKALQAMSGLLGEEFSAELELELNNLDDEDRSKLRRKLKKVFGDDGVHVSGGGGDGIGLGKFVIAMTAISLSLGLPIIVLVLVLMFSHRKRKQKMELISSYLNADQPVPEHVMAEFGSSSSLASPMRNGLQLALAGIAIIIALGIIDDWETATLGLIPFAIGAARLIAWKYDSNNTNLEGN
jgi:hypothetical protein